MTNVFIKEGKKINSRSGAPKEREIFQINKRYDELYAKWNEDNKMNEPMSKSCGWVLHLDEINIDYIV